MSITAMKQALEALDGVLKAHRLDERSADDRMKIIYAVSDAEKAILDLRQAIEQAEREQADSDEAMELLSLVFDAWENGTPCYEAPEDCDGFLGTAFILNDDVFKRCCDLLNRVNPPRNASTMPGWKMIRDSTLEERSWPEDYKRENGNYQNLCCICGRIFNGYKRRVMCRVCNETPTAPAQPVVGNTTCNPHPDAPHGFARNASHAENRYVCECEGWMPPVRPLTDEQINLDIGAAAHDALISAVETKVKIDILPVLKGGDSKTIKHFHVQQS